MCFNLPALVHGNSYFAEQNIRALEARSATEQRLSNLIRVKAVTLTFQTS